MAMASWGHPMDDKGKGVPPDIWKPPDMWIEKSKLQLFHSSHSCFIGSGWFMMVYD